MSTTSDTSETCWEIIYVYLKTNQLLLYEGNAYVNSIEDTQGGIMRTDGNETSIAGSSVLCDIIVQELARQALDRPSFN